MQEFIIYGAGCKGRSMYGFLRSKGLEGLVRYFVDRNAEEIKEIDGKKVLSFEQAKEEDIPFVIVTYYKALNDELEEILKKADKVYYSDLNCWAVDNGFDMVKWNREFCAYYHITDMDNYFSSAESEQAMNIFWGQDTLFYNMFKKLDISNVIELSCGRGRHVPKYMYDAQHITLVDILEKNIDFCKERFSSQSKISYYCNNGSDLSDLPDNTYTSLFTYDSMVHFELLDIASYLKDIYRVLKPDGLALFHHSNNSSDYKLTYTNAPHGRNYMSADVFAYLAYRMGFQIVEQQIFDWKPEKDLDCLTLVKKPQ